MKSTTTTAFVVKAFAYAHDGKTVVQLAEGDQVEIHSDLIEGLTAEGFISPEAPKAAKASKRGKAEPAPAADPEPEPVQEPEPEPAPEPEPTPEAQ